MSHHLKLIYFGWLLVTAFAMTQCSQFPQRPRRETTPARWEKIFFRSIDAATKASNLVPLREKALRHDEFEVRVWRGFGLSPLEGVIIRSSGGALSGIHILGNDYYEIIQTKTTHLDSPKSGWDSFWTTIDEMGILTLPEPTDEVCTISTLDGTGYVVEISNDGVYRTYMYKSGLPKCENSIQMDKIGEFIGEEFHNGTQPCETAEWFPCSELLRRRREKGLND